MLDYRRHRAKQSQKKADEISDKVDEAVANLSESGIINIKVKNSELGAFKKRLLNDENIESEYYSIIRDRFSHGSNFAKEAFNKYVPDDSILEYDFPATPHYNPTTKKISMNCEMDKINPRGSGVTWFHEHGHLIDDYAGRISQNERFGEVLRKDYMEYMMNYSKQHNLKTFDKVQKAISDDLSSMREHSGVSDIMHGLSKGNIHGVASHDISYWRQKGSIESEAFAHMFECQFDKARYMEMKKYFPNALAEFEKILKGAL